MLNEVLFFELRYKNKQNAPCAVITEKLMLPPVTRICHSCCKTSKLCKSCCECFNSIFYALTHVSKYTGKCKC